ncbi:MAG TPA: hypothetical protein VIS52_01860 [Motiliproteus sp.]
MTNLTLDLEITRATLLQRWNNPHPDFASGQDQRSSDRGLLELLYGSMEHGAHFNWHNAGRTLIDKTYLAILWAAQGLAPLSISFEQLAACLDAFIRDELAPEWESLAELEHETRHQRTLELVNAASVRLFGSQPNPTAASQLLLFLCPQLPLFPYSEKHRHALERLAPAHTINNYADYHRACRTQLAIRLPALQPDRTAVQASTHNPELNRLLQHSDWWSRRLLAEQIVVEALVVRTAYA